MEIKSFFDIINDYIENWTEDSALPKAETKEGKIICPACKAQLGVDVLDCPGGEISVEFVLSGKCPFCSEVFIFRNDGSYEGWKLEYGDDYVHHVSAGEGVHPPTFSAEMPPYEGKVLRSSRYEEVEDRGSGAVIKDVLCKCKKVLGYESRYYLGHENIHTNNTMEILVACPSCGAVNTVSCR